MSRDNPRSQAWAAFYANHPEVVATWGEANGYEPNCGCHSCDPDGLQPAGNVVVAQAQEHES